MMASPSLSAAILVGGKSRRMGRTKALIRLHSDGPTAIELACAALATVANEIVLVGNAPADDYAFLGLRHVPDLVPGAGVLGGIHAAIRTAHHEHVLVVACDMPFLNTTLLRHMASLPRDWDALIPLLGQPQTAHAIYARSALPLIEASLAAHRFRATSWLAQGRVRIVPRATIAAFDPTLRSCFNMNAPADLALARQLAREDR